MRVTWRWLCAMSLLGAGCASDSAGTGPECNATSDCAGGSVCLENVCETLCTADLQCSAGQICAGTICTDGSRSNIPNLTAIDGDDAVVCPDTPGTNCILNGLILGGEHLEGAAFTLLDGSSNSYSLAIRPGATDSRVVVDLPDVAPGTYSLVVANGVGSSDQTLTLLQGQPGAPGMDANMTGAEIVTRINTDSMAGSISTNRLPVGTGSAEIAAGDHAHDIDQITTPAVNPSDFALLKTLGLGVTDPSGLLHVSDGYAYNLVANVSGTPTPPCDCDQNPTVYDCGQADFRSNYSQGAECYDTGTGGNDHYQTSTTPALLVQSNNRVAIGRNNARVALDVEGQVMVGGFRTRHVALTGQSSGGGPFDSVLLDAASAPYGGWRGWVDYNCHLRGNTGNLYTGRAYFAAAIEGGMNPMVVTTLINGDIEPNVNPRWVGTDLTVTVPQYYNCSFLLNTNAP